MRPLRGEDPGHGADDDLLFVEAGDQHADQRTRIRIEHSRGAALCVQAVPKTEDRHEEKPGDAQDDRGNEKALHAGVHESEKAKSDAVEPEFSGAARGGRLMPAS